MFIQALPFDIGETIYTIPSYVNFKLNVLNGYSENNKVYTQKIESITFTKDGWYIECDKDKEYDNGEIYRDKAFKKIWFLSKGEADKRLKEMEKENNE